MFKEFFKGSKKKKYATISEQLRPSDRDVPDNLLTKCPACKKVIFTKDLVKNDKVCLHCNFHLVMNALERVKSITDESTFVEFNKEMSTANPLNFPGYEKKIAGDKKKTSLNEAVITGTAKISNFSVILAVMDSTFRMGSMGSVVGEKIALAIEKASELKLPFVIFTASGGARMQEGVISLMQMAKTSAALKRFSDDGGLSIVIMTHPTTGGVSASFASLGDYNISEPQALIGFAGRRIIEQTIREELPKDFQSAEFLLEHGQLDAVVKRRDLCEVLGKILAIHQNSNDFVGQKL